MNLFEPLGNKVGDRVVVRQVIGAALTRMRPGLLLVVSTNLANLRAVAGHPIDDNGWINL